MGDMRCFTVMDGWSFGSATLGGAAQQANRRKKRRTNNGLLKVTVLGIKYMWL